MKITMFKDINHTGEPHYVEIKTVFDRIRTGKSKDLIERIRSCIDSKERASLKQQLPCIIFSGIFKKRTDIDCIGHSGFAVLDFDHVEDIERLKDTVQSKEYIYSHFISPSGNGLKAVAKIPPIIGRHKGHYLAIINDFLDSGYTLDTTSKNISRICFESYDPEIYINESAGEFTGFVEDTPEFIEIKEAKYTNYAKLNIALNIIRESRDGEKHYNLLKASRLAGGFIASGEVDEIEAVRLLENEISKKNINDIEGAKKTIQSGINHGKNDPIKDVTYNVSNDNDLDYINSIRYGTLEQGKSTGLRGLDKYFRFKKNHLTIFLGHDNVGKSLIVWWLSMLSALRHDWKWVIYSSENTSGHVKLKLIESFSDKKISKLTDPEFNEATDFIKDHFKVIKHNDELYNYKQIIAIAKDIYKTWQYEGIIIDPYNSLYIDKKELRGISTHDYHYEAMSVFRMFKEKYASIYLTTHAVTEALRKTYSKDREYAGHPIPPGKADAEGGGKFSNRSDDFITIHRMTQHPTRWNITEFHVRKIKEIETGGRITIIDEPVLLKLNDNGCNFIEYENIKHPGKGDLYKKVGLEDDIPF